jgi:hypothetical protein
MDSTNYEALHQAFFSHLLFITHFFPSPLYVPSHKSKQSGQNFVLRHPNKVSTNDLQNVIQIAMGI